MQRCNIINNFTCLHQKNKYLVTRCINFLYYVLFLNELRVHFVNMYSKEATFVVIPAVKMVLSLAVVAFSVSRLLCKTVAIHVHYGMHCLIVPVDLYSEQGWSQVLSYVQVQLQVYLNFSTSTSKSTQQST